MSRNGTRDTKVINKRSMSRSGHQRSQKQSTLVCRAAKAFCVILHIGFDNDGYSTLWRHPIWHLTEIPGQGQIEEFQFIKSIFFSHKSTCFWLKNLPRILAMSWSSSAMCRTHKNADESYGNTFSNILCCKNAKIIFFEKWHVYSQQFIF